MNAFLQLVANMRGAQTAYFRHRSSTLLQTAKGLEAQVDRVLAQFHADADQPLFPPEATAPGLHAEHFEAMNEELLAALRAHPGVAIHMTAAVALTTIGQLQLALRQGPSSILAKQVVVALIEEVARGDPRIVSLLKRGEDPRYDVFVSVPTKGA